MINYFYQKALVILAKCSSGKKFEKVVITLLLNIGLHPSSTNPTKWSNILKQLSAVADNLFECVWPFYGVGA